MPGFTSFFLSSTPQPPSRCSSPELETPAQKAHRIQQARRRARQVTNFFGTIMTRSETEQTLHLLQRLKSDIDAQIENFHDMGFMDKKERIPAIKTFVDSGHRVWSDGSRAVMRFRSAQGIVGEVAEGLGLLKNGLGEQGEGKMDVADVERVVVVYQRRVLGPLRELIKGVERALRRKDGWVDA